MGGDLEKKQTATYYINRLPLITRYSGTPKGE